MALTTDKYWRYYAVSRCGLKHGEKGLNVCCDTGMLTIEMARAAGGAGEVENIGKKPYEGIIKLVQGNAVDLPFPDDYFDCAIVGFALRNVPDIEKTKLTGGIVTVREGVVPNK